MCVDTKNHDWERPARKSDCAILALHFSAVDFDGLLDAMSRDDARPLTADLALVGGALSLAPDEHGMRFLPFSGMEDNGSTNIVKLPVMDQIVEWFENSALGTDMWKNASDFLEEQSELRVHFAMNCGCKVVPVSAYADGKCTAWKRHFNRSRSHLFGRTTVVRRETNSLAGLDITKAQLMMWHRIRKCLEALPAATVAETQLAA